MNFAQGLILVGVALFDIKYYINLIYVSIQLMLKKVSPFLRRVVGVARFQNTISYGLIDQIKYRALVEGQPKQFIKKWFHYFNINRWIFSQGIYDSIQQCKQVYFLMKKNIGQLTSQEKKKLLLGLDTIHKLKIIMLVSILPFSLAVIIASLLKNPRMAPSHFLTQQQYKESLKMKMLAQVQAVEYLINHPVNCDLQSINNLKQLQKINDLFSGIHRNGVCNINLFFNKNFEYFLLPSLSMFFLKKAIRRQVQNDLYVSQELRSLNFNQRFKIILVEHIKYKRRILTIIDYQFPQVIEVENRIKALLKNQNKGQTKSKLNKNNDSILKKFKKNKID